MKLFGEKWGRWGILYQCTTCKTYLPFSTVMDSHGVCPVCGEVSGNTMVNVVSKSYRSKYRTFLGIPFKEIHGEYGNKTI